MKRADVNELSRRDFIEDACALVGSVVGSTMVGVTVAGTALASCGGAPEPLPSGAAALADAYFGPSSSPHAATVGRWYLDATAPGWTPETAADQIADLLHMAETTTDAGRSSVVLALDGVVGADFAAGRVVDVAGWTLGLTEVQLCVLAAIAT